MTLALLVATAATPGAQSPPRPRVVLDGFHNREPQPHYRWDGRYAGGFSDLAGVLDTMAVLRTTVEEPLTPAVLSRADCLIIVDPDIPSESPDPQYISASEAQAVAGWVNGGGLLLLLGNDPGNAEFEHLNGLASRFGLRFLEKVHKDAKGNVKLTITVPPGNPVFSPGLQFYAVQVAPLEVTNPKAQVLLEDNGEPILAVVPYGRGRVLALGDPWLYNEYIHTRDNYQMAGQLLHWLLRPRP